MADDWNGDIYIISDESSYKGDGRIILQTDSACEMFEQLYEEANKNAAVGVGADVQALARAERACREETAARVPPKPPPQPVTPKRPPAGQGAPVAPNGEDSPREQDAPDVRANVKITRVPSPTAVDPKRPSDAVFERVEPKPPSVVGAILNPGFTPAEVEAMLRRAERNEPEPGQPHPSHAGPSAARPAAEADPVDLFTGAFTVAGTDLVVPTPLLPIRFERCYRSGRPYYGPFGYGWDHNYNVFLRPLTGGDVALWTGRLAERRFTAVADGFEPEAGLTARLERTADGFKLVHPQGLRWQFSRPAGWGDGLRTPLTGVADRFGNRLRFSYDSQDRLAAVLDDAGRGLLLRYGDCGLLEHVTDDTGVREVRYDHDGEAAHLVRVIQPGTARYPGGVVTRYEYDASAEHPAMRHNILRIVDADGRVAVHNEYAGPGEGWSFNAVTRQLAGDYEYRFGYEPIQYVPSLEENLDVPAARSCVRRPDGALHTYTFNWRGDLLDHRFRLNRDRTARVVVTRAAYDAAGNTVEAVGPSGIRMLRTYDTGNPDPCARGNLLRVEIAAPVTGIVPSRTLFAAKYEPRYQLPTEVSTEGQGTTRLRYDFDVAPAGGTGRLARVELPAATLDDGTIQPSVLTIEHNPAGQPVAATSAAGRRVAMEYLSGGRTGGCIHRTVTDPDTAALATAVDYDPLGFPAALTAPGGRRTGLRHNLLGQLEEVTAPEVDGVAAVTRWWLDDSGGLVQLTRPGARPGEELTDRIVRDALGHAVQAIAAAGDPAERRYRQKLDADGRAVTTWSPGGLRVDSVYGENGALVRRTEATGTSAARTSTYAHDVAGRVTRATNPLGQVTRYGYDVWGRIRSVTRPSGAVCTYTWGAGDRVVALAVTEADGTPLARTTWDYDERGRTRSQTNWAFDTDPAAAVPLTTSYRYDADDNVIAVQPPRGAPWTYRYDGCGRLSSATDPLGGVRTLGYDPAGDLVSLTVSEQGVSTVHAYTYDGRGRLTGSHVAGDVTQLRYDNRDVLAERVSEGVRTDFETDAHGNVTATVVDPAGLALRTRVGYDADGRAVTCTDPAGRGTTWQRDAFGEPVAVTGPDGLTWQRSFDPVQRSLRRRMPSGNETTLTFGAHPGPVALTSAAAPGYDPVPPYEFGYDGLGRLTRAADGVTEVRRRFDSLGRLVEERAAGRTVRLAYDDTTGAVDLVYPDGRTERTEQTPDGRPARVVLTAAGALGGTPGDVLLDLAYTAQGHLDRATYGNGVRADYGHDTLGRPVRVDYRTGEALLESCRIRHDDRGHRALVQCLGAPGADVLHGFDGAGRLVEARWGLGLGPLPDASTAAAQAAQVDAARLGAAGAPGVAYDLDGGDGRVARRGRNGGVPDLAYGTGPDHRIVQAGAEVLSYGPDGRCTADGRFRYRLDALGRVVAVTDTATGTVVAELRRDPLARVRSGTSGGTSFERWYAGDAVHETIGGGLRQTSPHPLWPAPLCVVDGAGPHYQHQDDAWSTILVTDAAGGVRRRLRYDPFGAPAGFAADGTPEPGVPDGVRWRGMPPLGDTGLYATPQRLYAPALGAFLDRDPLLYADSPSPYVFAGHNPADHADPTGWAKQALGPPSLPRQAWDWFSEEAKKPLWYYDPHDPSDLLPQHRGVDTGNVVTNLLANTFIGVSNFLARLINLPGNLLAIGKHGLRGIGWSDTDLDALDIMLVETRLAEVFKGVGYVASLAADALGWRRAVAPAVGAVATAQRSRALPVVAAELEGPPLPEVIIPYDPVMRINPTTANWVRSVLEWAMTEQGYFERGVRPVALDNRLRRWARRWMDLMGHDREGLQAMHPIDDLMGGSWRRGGNIGTTYYFGEQEINGAFGRMVSNELGRLGVRTPGQRFTVRFVGDWPSYIDVPPTAPIASPPWLTSQYLQDLAAAQRRP
ncbi:DUF6531 domain-containing protein [Dactylosporangium sp. CS-047395]|uniref:DUF6531 domain-containing protein n=1 Tax=Dactylosporangium sp. CS-047395 TaxID=3239936 RepID=UPI003D92BB1C